MDPQAQRGQTISWEVTTHVHRERSNDWYWGLGIITVVGAIVSIVLGNVLFAIVLVLGLGSVGVLMARGPRQHSVHIDARGISIDGTLHPFRSIQTFWVEQHTEQPRLLLTMHSIIAPHIALPLPGKAEGGQIRSFLKRVVEEEEQEPHLGEHLAEMFGL